MAENKKSFVLYADLIHTVNKLNNEQAGLLLKHLLSYVNDENPITNDIVIEIAFEPIKQQLKRDLKDWEATVQRKSDGGKKGMAKRWGEKTEPVKLEPKKEHQFFNTSKIPVEQYFESLIKGDAINEIASKNNIPIDFVKKYIDVFKTKANSDGYLTYGKFKDHFRNSLSIAYKNKASEIQTKSKRLD